MPEAEMLLAIAYPKINPVIFEIGPFALRWYAVAYIAGLVLGWLYMRRLAAGPPELMGRQQADDVLMWVTLGVVLGGRLGYVLFYKPGYYIDHVVDALRIWEGGMSFHGGLLGVVVAIVLFARHGKIRVLTVADLIACAVPIGLFLGRIANFINGELWGRVSDVPWAMVFPHPLAGPLPRHPSQLYEATLEGVVLFVVLGAVFRYTDARRRPGLLTGIFCAGYALSRITVEFFREPDQHLGYLAGGATMGQVLSIPLLLFGIWLIARARARPPIPENG